jgi:hypothetical protein
MTAVELALAAAIGIVAGVLGGLAGVGGSMVMLPGLHLVFGSNPASVHHLYMAAAMTVNVAVALPAAIGHHRARAVRGDLLRVLLPSALAGICAGVLTSNLVDGRRLKLLLAAFIVGYCLLTLARFLRRHHEDPAQERATVPRLGACGVAAGLVAGLLGLGGGVVLVPLLQVLCRVCLRQAIATSTGVICVTAAVGAVLKLATLDRHGQSVLEALVLAAMMAPTAMLGARIGAWATHALPLQAVRLAITLILLAAAAGMAGLL